jgi:hypothetical protein
MRSEVRWKAVQRISRGRLAHTMATCTLCSERRSKTLRRPHEQTARYADATSTILQTPFPPIGGRNNPVISHV